MARFMLQKALQATQLIQRHQSTRLLQNCSLQRPPISGFRSRYSKQIYLRRNFTTSKAQAATVVSQNPRTDDDGKEMLITISDRAAKITSTPPQKNTLVQKSKSSSDSHLRVTVTSGGCHGFQYLMSLESADKVDPEEDTVFTFVDGAETGDPAKVVLDEPSLELLKGSTVDFTTELIGSQFKIVGNPRATSSCGCGTSFDIE